MSVDATRSTWKLQNISAIQKLILLSLADRAGENGECWPSIKRLEVDTCLNRKTIIENRQLLISQGILVYTGDFKGKQKQIPVMRLTYLDNREGFVEESTSTENGTSENSHKCYLTSTENGTGTSTENGTGNQYRKRDTEPKSLLNLKDEPKRSLPLSSKKGTSQLKDYEKDERFMSFYNAYPRKRDPWDAWKAFKSIIKTNDALLEIIITDIELRKLNHSQWADKKFIKYPAVYLRKGEYLGDIENYAQEVAEKKERQRLEAEAKLQAQEKASQKRADEQRKNEESKQKDGAIYREIRKTITHRTNERPDGLKNLRNQMGIN